LCSLPDTKARSAGILKLVDRDCIRRGSRQVVSIHENWKMKQQIIKKGLVVQALRVINLLTLPCLF